MIQRQDEHRAYFTLIGDFEPAAVSKILNLQPSRCFTKGDSKPRTGRPYEFSRWSLESRLQRSEAGNLHVQDVLAQIRPAKEAIQLLRKKYDGWLQLVGMFSSQGGFDIDATWLEELAQMNLGIDFDVYMLSDEEAHT